jgi:hypothetical protein
MFDYFSVIASEPPRLNANLLIRHTMRHMPCSNVLTSGFAMFLLVIKENVRSESLQEFTFVLSTQEQCFINADVPCA